MTGYTREQLEAMEPRELDAVVAEVVLGYRWYDCTNGVDFSWISRLMHPSEAAPRWNHPVDRPSHPVTGEAPYFSSSWGGFGLVIDRVQNLGFSINLDYEAGKGRWSADIDSMVEAFGASLPHAMAIASILAVQKGEV